MTRSEYLSQLRFSLSGKLPENEINDIMRDYAEYFEDGKVAGKSEEEIAKNLGIPSVTAREILSEGSGRFKNKGVSYYWGKVKNTLGDFVSSGEVPTDSAYGSKTYNEPPPESQNSGAAYTSQGGAPDFNSYGGNPYMSGGKNKKRAKKPPKAKKERRNKNSYQNDYSEGPGGYNSRGEGFGGNPPPPYQSSYQGGAAYGSDKKPPRKKGGFGRAVLSLMGGFAMFILAICLLPLGIGLLMAMVGIIIAVVAVLVALVVAFVAILIGGIVAFSTLISLGAVIPFGIYILFFLTLIGCAAATILSACLVVYLVKGIIGFIRFCFGRQEEKKSVRNPVYEPGSYEPQPERPQHEEPRYKKAEEEYRSPFTEEPQPVHHAPTDSERLDMSEPPPAPDITKPSAWESKDLEKPAESAEGGIADKDAEITLETTKTESTVIPEISLELPDSPKTDSDADISLELPGQPADAAEDSANTQTPDSAADEAAEQVLKETGESGGNATEKEGTQNA